MARDSNKIPAFIKTIMQEIFYEAGHSQNNGAFLWKYAALLRLVPYQVSLFNSSLPIGHSSTMEPATYCSNNSLLR